MDLNYEYAVLPFAGEFDYKDLENYVLASYVHSAHAGLMGDRYGFADIGEMIIKEGDTVTFWSLEMLANHDEGMLMYFQCSDTHKPIVRYIALYTDQDNSWTIRPKTVQVTVDEKSMTDESMDQFYVMSQSLSWKLKIVSDLLL